MKVKELIEELKKYDEDTMVIISGYEGGVDEVNNVAQTKIDINVNKAWYYGKHEETSNGGTQAIYLTN